MTAKRSFSKAHGSGNELSAVRSDGSTLRVDFENVADTLITARNAGVIIDYQTRAQILNDFAFEGRRCAQIAASAPGEEAQVRLIRAWDAPAARDRGVLEFVYRPVLEEPVRLVNWPVIRCFDPGRAPGPFELKYLNDPVYGADALVADGVAGQLRPVAIGLCAHGRASDGTYSINVAAEDGVHKRVLADLPQAAWTRFILHRRHKAVHLFAGPPEQERFVGTYPDMLPGEEIYMILLGNPEDPDAKGSGYWDCVRLGRPLSARRKLAPPEGPIRNVGEIIPPPPRELKLGREKHLLIDDWSVAETRNIRRTFHRPVKHAGNPLIVCDRPWEPLALYLLGGVERLKDGRYRMWYNAADPTPENRKNVHTCLATSDDGIHWTKPNLGIHEYKGSMGNNIVIKNAGPSTVFMNPNDPRPDFRYLAKIRHQGTQGWTSADGLHWTNHGVILPQSLDASDCQWDPVRKKYIASIKLGYKGRRYRGYAESDDFLNWTDTCLMMDIDELDVSGDEIYRMPIFRHEGLYLGFCKIYHARTSDTCDIHLAVSHNCKHWERPYRGPGTGGRGPEFRHLAPDRRPPTADPHTQPFIPTGSPGSWDFGNNDSPGTGPVRAGNDLLFYYGGRPCTHSGKDHRGRKWKGKCGAIGLATLRLDGFVSADADASGGWVLTKPLKLDGSNLYLNADAKGGALKAEVLDTRLRPIEPFTLANARAIRSDAVRKKCWWKGAPELSALKRRTVRFRFHLTGASLYAFWCE